MKPFKKSVVGGALLLSAAVIIVNVLGMLYKLPLAALLREEGMGYFNSAYTVYSFFFLLSTAGLPVAVSILVSASLARPDRDRREALRILRVTITGFAIIGLAICIGLVFLAERFAHWIGNPPAAAAIAAIAPALLFVCILSALRGYFQGCGNMLPTALSQIVEAAGKLTFGILLARWAMLRYKDAASAASFAVLGVTIGTFLAMLCLIPAWIRETRRAPRLSVAPADRPDSALSITARLWRIALPVTLSASVMSLAGLLDLFLVLRRLTDAGYTPGVANALYGSYSGLAVTLANLPIVLITPIACATVPILSSALARGRKETARSVAHTALRVTVLIAAPCAVGMSLLAPQILRLLFEDSMADGAAPYLKLLAPSILFVALCNVSGALLQAMGKVKTPLLSMSAGAVVKLISAWILLGKYGMEGAPVSTLLCYLTITAMNFAALAREGVRITFRGIFGVSLFAALVCGATALFGQRIFDPALGELSCLPAAGLGAAVYLLLLLLLGGITRAEWRLIPGGRAVCRRLEKWGLLKRAK